MRLRFIVSLVLAAALGVGGTLVVVNRTRGERDLDRILHWDRGKRAAAWRMILADPERATRLLEDPGTKLAIDATDYAVGNGVTSDHRAALISWWPWGRRWAPEFKELLITAASDEPPPESARWAMQAIWPSVEDIDMARRLHAAWCQRVDVDVDVIIRGWFTWSQTAPRSALDDPAWEFPFHPRWERLRQIQFQVPRFPATTPTDFVRQPSDESRDEVVARADAIIQSNETIHPALSAALLVHKHLPIDERVDLVAQWGRSHDNQHVRACTLIATLFRDDELRWRFQNAMRGRYAVEENPELKLALWYGFTAGKRRGPTGARELRPTTDRAMQFDRIIAMFQMDPATALAEIDLDHSDPDVAAMHRWVLEACAPGLHEACVNRPLPDGITPGEALSVYMIRTTAPGADVLLDPPDDAYHPIFPHMQPR